MLVLHFIFADLQRQLSFDQGNWCLLLSMMQDNRTDAMYTCGVGILLRVIFTVYGCLHDALFQLKFTDIDYTVFTDGAKYIYNGKSPYNRGTYRYSPLLAWALIPNITVHHVFGKIMFSILDVLTGMMMLAVLRIESKQVNPVLLSNKLKFMNLFWFWNPFVIVISTRGSAEAMQSFLVISTLYFLANHNYSTAGAFYGLSVHFKIYPIIFCLPILLFLHGNLECTDGGWIVSKTSCLKLLFSCLRKKDVWMFFMPAGGLFLMLLGIMYMRYGFIFLHETYLYHFSRTDLKHNFSPYFYILNLIHATWMEKVIGLLTFLPQATLVIWLGIKYYRRLALACMLQVFAFVSLNKVCTSQYFIWYICLLPLALNHMAIDSRKGLKMLSAWCVAQCLWLGFAYLYEYQGYDVLFFVWMASVIFLGVNIWILRTFMNCADVLEDLKK